MLKCTDMTKFLESFQGGLSHDKNGESQLHMPFKKQMSIMFVYICSTPGNQTLISSLLEIIKH